VYTRQSPLLSQPITDYSAISLAAPREPLLRDPLDVVGSPHRAAAVHSVVVGRAVRVEGEEQQAVAWVTMVSQSGVRSH